ncbi:YceH family protein [Actimicrobium sp. CCI2.3]|uniref:YceH family protein n=1 Tax=Actimicrobium sp. CCI2.3 TaxID=3048616 RepID=UPI002AB4EE84|nr:YceH family protein [Actimicrobium sp. CCI2.3]MDY7575376.1 YceH family protein [Actimicrobium sp. CCI2.3]MEB0021287.1 YceH family protein [Actimicrobium sp. CCI2.3]
MTSEDQHTIFDQLEIRVLAVLSEKEATTPDAYPLSLNALTNGCNQLSSRDPVMTLSDAAVHDVLQRLMQRKLVVEVSQAGARVAKFEHRMRIKWSLEPDKLAVLTVLMLRGSQTAGEIRARCERLHAFETIEQVEACLQFLIDKYPPLVAKLARGRYVSLLAGESFIEQQEIASVFSGKVNVQGATDRLSQLEAEVTRLQTGLDDLSAQFALFKRQFD